MMRIAQVWGNERCGELKGVGNTQVWDNYECRYEPHTFIVVRVMRGLDLRFIPHCSTVADCCIRFSC